MVRYFLFYAALSKIKNDEGLKFIAHEFIGISDEATGRRIRSSVVGASKADGQCRWNNFRFVKTA
jgi:hypothetical protein